MIDFKEFYEPIEFNLEREVHKIFRFTQGDTKSRGLIVTVFQGNILKDMTGTETMKFFAQKPDGTRIIIDAIMEGAKFKIDFTNQTFAAPGILLCALVLYGGNGEKISDKKFRAIVDNSLEDGAIISQDERGILDRAFELATDVVPVLENLEADLTQNENDRVIAETGRVNAENTRAGFYDGFNASLSALATDVNAQLAEITNTLTTENQGWVI